MRVERALRVRESQLGRHGRPWEIFYKQYRELLDAGESLTPEQPYLHLLERSIAITAVTAIETYFKDMLDLIVTYCDQSFVDPVLSKIHTAKYNISDLLFMYDKELHPLDLISANQSFQNIDAIESVFSKFIGRSLWGSVIGLQMRLKDEPERVIKCEPEHLNSLKQVFETRHELVHSPGKEAPIITEGFWGDMVFAMSVVGSTNAILVEMINSNLSKAYLDHLKKNNMEPE
jgi:hypothetical protein